MTHTVERSKLFFFLEDTYCPVNDQVVIRGSSAFHVAGVLMRYILGCQTNLGVARGQRIADFVARDHAEGVVGPGRHGHREGGVGGGHNVYKKKKREMGQFYVTINNKWFLMLM